ncbi:MAG TPA: NAD(P)/FAD-dependent oxidoreductase [Pyrinomonadaceae bacterium]|jgi:flavin-dependent dehydrogenase|nr:NAD(P)/FAD-dependent oxidoreductase [Pyrinomonadaceae bacterium]
MSAVSDYDVIIAGGGPAGSSAAIHLALRGARVLLVEQKKFPRAKLCGEFISPECAAHFERLGVTEQMFASGPAKLTETVFYSHNGTNVSVPSDWFSAGGMAIGLSRAEMDERLLRRAAAVGVEVREDTAAVNLVSVRGRVTGVVLKHNGTEERFTAPVTIDATGRARVLTRLLERICSVKSRLQRASLVAFKAHLRETRVAPGACEIYFYRGGYGGLSSIESGLSNLCFIVNAREVKANDSDPNRLMRKVVCENRRAAYTLENARLGSEWLAVSLEKFGRHSPAPAPGLLAIGDAASFIDPFTGSGMLMALESGELVSGVIVNRLAQLSSESVLEFVGEKYEQLYRTRFNSRLRVCSMIRRAAFVPGFADLAIRFFGLSASLRRSVASATRSTERRLNMTG